MERIAKAPAGPAPEAAAPARSAPSPAGLLAIQRAGGNQATLALLRSSTDVVRRAWVPRSFGEGVKWDDEVEGLQWYRKVDEAGATVYWYQWADDDAPIAALQADLEAEHEASWWATWAHRATYWLPAFTGEAAPAAAAPVAAEVAEPEEAPDDAPAAPVPVATVAARQADPTVTSVRAPEFAPGGGFSWPVTMAVTAVPTMSWVVQKVELALEGSPAETFWEAFIVAPGAAAAHEQDIYLDSQPSGRASGHSIVTGTMQHHVLPGTGGPPGFAQGAAPRSAGGQWSKAGAAAPDFWVDGQGTQHNLDLVWDDTAGTRTITTVPNGGAAVVKADVAAFTPY